MTLGILRRVKAILRISNPTVNYLPLTAVEMDGTVRPKAISALRATFMS